MAAFRRGVHRMVMRAESDHYGTSIEIATVLGKQRDFRRFSGKIWRCLARRDSHFLRDGHADHVIAAALKPASMRKCAALV
jgi:hypothetical protein